MATIVFDSHTFVKRLRATGFTEEQAEVIVDASRDALAQLVTKDDLRESEMRIIIKVGAMIAAAVGVLIAVLRLPHQW
ncbi:conserved hypothetical protein [Gammaproteobacteria bacterium]